LAYSASKCLGISGSNLENLSHWKCQNAGVNGKWMLPKCKSNNNNSHKVSTLKVLQYQVSNLTSTPLITTDNFLHVD